LTSAPQKERKAHVRVKIHTTVRSKKRNAGEREGLSIRCAITEGRKKRVHWGGRKEKNRGESNLSNPIDELGGRRRVKARHFGLRETKDQTAWKTEKDAGNKMPKKEIENVKGGPNSSRAKRPTLGVA